MVRPVGQRGGVDVTCLCSVEPSQPSKGGKDGGRATNKTGGVAKRVLTAIASAFQNVPHDFPDGGWWVRN